MKVIQQLRLKNGDVVNAGEPMLDPNGAAIRVQLTPENKSTYPVLLSAITFVPDLEMEDDEGDVTRVPAQYQLLYWIVISDDSSPEGFQGIPHSTVDVVWASDVARVRETWLKEDVAVATAEWFAQDEQSDETETEAPPPNGQPATETQTTSP